MVICKKYPILGKALILAAAVGLDLTLRMLTGTNVPGLDDAGRFFMILKWEHGCVVVVDDSPLSLDGPRHLAPVTVPSGRRVVDVCRDHTNP